MANYTRRQRDVRMRTEARQARIAQAYRAVYGERRVSFVAVLEAAILAAAVLALIAALVLYGHLG